jgi:hypothetical protein
MATNPYYGGVFNRPRPPKKRPSKFSRAAAPVKAKPPQKAPEAIPVTAGDVRAAQNSFAEGKRELRLKDKAAAMVRKAVFGQSQPDTSLMDTMRVLSVPCADDLVTVHSCTSALHGKQCRNCKSRVPRQNAERLVFDGTHKWVEFQREGKPYRSSKAVVAIKARPEQVLVHICSLSERCYCKHYVEKNQAENLVIGGKASWRPVERKSPVDGKRVQFEIHSAIVLSAAEIARVQAEIQRQKLPHTGPIARFRTAMARYHVGENLADEEILAAMCGKYVILELPLRAACDVALNGDAFALSRALRASTPTLTDYFLRCVGWYWNKLIPSVMRYTYLKNAPQGKGILVTGNYDTLADGDLDLISWHSVAGDPYNDDDEEHSPASWHNAIHDAPQDRRVKPKGIGPDSFERDDKALGAQSDSAPDPNYAGERKGEDYEGAAAKSVEDAVQTDPISDNRVAPSPVEWDEDVLEPEDSIE